MRSSRSLSCVSLCSALGLWLASAPAAAQITAANAAETVHADDEGRSARPDEAPRELRWRALAGAVLNAGNTQSVTMNAGTDVRWAEDWNRVVVEALGTFGASCCTTDPTVDMPNDNYLGEGWARNAQNLAGRVRYDRYLTPVDTLWITVLGRHDPFAGLDFRLQGRAGYARDVFREENHTLSAEVGYDFTIDWQIDEDPTMPANPNPLPQHSLILNLAYVNNVNEYLTFGTSLEALFDLTDETGIVPRPAMEPFPQENNGRYNLRLTSESTLGFRVDTALAVQIKVKLIYDADPVPGREPLDVATTLNMVLTLI